MAVAAWQDYEALSTAELGRALLDIAAHVDPRKMRKHPRGPKKPKKKSFVPPSEASRHVSTARVLKEGRIQQFENIFKGVLPSTHAQVFMRGYLGP